MNFATCPGGPPGPPWEWALHPPLPATCRRSGAVLSHTPRAGWVYFVEDPKHEKKDAIVAHTAMMQNH